jgi:molecular chaperone HscB
VASQFNSSGRPREPVAADADAQAEAKAKDRVPSPRVSGYDPFALLGLSPAYGVDLAALERAFFERSKQLHPDRMAGAPAAERVAVLSRSRALNDAYQLIKKPVARAEYLLARAGVTIGDNERLDPAFLMEILELREELAEARAAGNSELVARLQGAMQARRTGALAALPALFAAGDLTAIKDRLILLRYINRYLEECDAALDEA